MKVEWYFFRILLLSWATSTQWTPGSFVSVNDVHNIYFLLFFAASSNDSTCFFVPKNVLLREYISVCVAAHTAHTVLVYYLYLYINTITYYHSSQCQQNFRQTRHNIHFQFETFTGRMFQLTWKCAHAFIWECPIVVFYIRLRKTMSIYIPLFSRSLYSLTSASIDEWVFVIKWKIERYGFNMLSGDNSELRHGWSGS